MQFLSRKTPPFKEAVAFELLSKVSDSLRA